MPIQAPQWSDYLNCPVCCREFNSSPRSPISLKCGHSLCKLCLQHLHKKQCPFDQTVIQVDPDELVVNTALLQLAGYPPPAQPYHPSFIQGLSETDIQAYDTIAHCLEKLAEYLKCSSNTNNNMSGSCLSRPMQRKLVTLLQCSITDEEGRGRAVRAARSLGERSVTELILQQQNPQELSANLWAAVRARGCQFLGPAMQEEVLRLVLLALEDGSALSRKVLVMFVVQRLEPHFPQASKTSIGHVVQLLYRASCFKVSKRYCDSSLMQLKDEFRTYESLRREHDAQIVQIATESGLRIAPDQWSALLYGDTTRKSHMQSIIDKLQTPQSFSQSVQELVLALQRSGDSTQYVTSVHLDILSSIDPSPDSKSPSWQELANVMLSLKEVVSGLIRYLQQQATDRDSNHNQKHLLHDKCSEISTNKVSSQNPASTAAHRYKVTMCRDATRSFCPRGPTCTFAHSEEERERYRRLNQGNINGNHIAPRMTAPVQVQLPLNQDVQIPPFSFMQRYPPPLLPSYINNYTVPPIQPIPTNVISQGPSTSENQQDAIPAHNVIPTLVTNYAPTQHGFEQNGVYAPVPPPVVFGGVSELQQNIQYPVKYPQVSYQSQEQHIPLGMQLNIIPVTCDSRSISPFTYENVPPGFTPAQRGQAFCVEAPWQLSNNVFNFDSMRNALPCCSTNSNDMFVLESMYTALPTDSVSASDTGDIHEDELEEELLALERRIDTEFKSD